ncbi:MAG: uracil-DNA glycosylase [Clostridia bacterium]|nr:uracil-DNA glycosylase [Clostridia bacterium]
MKKGGICLDWTELENSCRECTKCSIGSKKKNCVFGCGNQNADIMFIGEAPGQSEDEMGIPFVGKAGKHFDKFLTALGMDREEVYIANILKCRPDNNRDPLPEEQDNCIGYLREQVKLVRPKLIVCLGRISAMRLIKPDFKITKEHGIFFKKGNYTVCAVYHPAALLRDPSKNQDMYIDMKKISQFLNN